ncbi:S9 family peptidase [Natrialbaceae archaeon GCM10025810]|uniref:S9 family peptidase n=1 Tax=Halovalidus salilacus TaxID=3075124 RepID=UPI0036120A02
MRTVGAADYHDIVRVSEPRLSPDGERVAFVRAVAADDESDEATVYVVPLGGDPPRQFTAADGVDGEPRWSPSGDRLAFVSTRGEGDRPQLWILPTDGGEARRVTGVVGGVSNLEWSPDGSRIVFTQSVTATDREEGRDLAVDPDYEPETPDPRVIDRMVYRSGTEYFDDRRSHVYVLDVEAALERAGSKELGDALLRLTEGDADHVAPTWGDDETVFYAAKSGEVPDDSVTYDVYAHHLCDVTVAIDVGDSSGPEEDDSSDPDGDDSSATPPGDAEVLTQTTGWLDSMAGTRKNLVAFPYTPEEKLTMRQTEVRVHDAETGREWTPTESLDRTLAYDGGFAWDPAGEVLYFTTPDGGSKVLWSVPAGDGDWNGNGDEDGNGDGSGSPKPTRVYGDDVTVEGFDVGENAVAVVQSEWDHPGDIFVTTRGGNETHRLTRVNDEYLIDRAVSEPEELRFEGGAPIDADEDGDGEGEGEGDDEWGSDGAKPEIQGWLLTPPDFDPSQTYPLIVEIHGGPHAHWTTAGTMWHEFQTLAARGYVVFWCNPRGSTGYGEDHEMAIERDWGDVTLSDVLAGVDRVCERDYVDSDQLFVTGGSFGGFMTAWTVGRTDRFRAAVAQRGVYDLTGFYGSTDEALKLVEYDFGVTPWDDPDFLRERSPVSLVPEVDTPTLVLHSDRDYRTPANTAELFYVGLKKHRVDSRLVRYPREGHELSRSGEPAHVVDRLERIARWFDGYSEHHDAPPALEREPGDGLTADDPADEREGRESAEN